MNRFNISKITTLAASFCYLAIGNSSVVAQPPYDPVWAKQVGTGQGDIALEIDVDGVGNAYVAGRIEGVGALDGAGMSTAVADVVKYSPSGDILWSRGGAIGAGSELDFKETGGVSEDGLGNVYVSGMYDSSGDGGNYDAFLRRYDTSGNLIWTRTIGGEDFEEFAGVATNQLGDVFLSGWTGSELATPAPGGGDGFLAKYNQAGDVQWIRQFGSPGFDEFWGVAADGLGNSFVIGTYEANEVFIRKYDADGDEAWTVITNAGPDGTEIGYDIFVSNSGDLLIAGQVNESFDTPPATGNFTNPFVAKLDTNGVFQWVTDLSMEGRAWSVAEDSAGLVHVVGQDWTTNQGFLTTLSATGDVLGTQAFAAGTSTTIFSVDTFGRNIYIAGSTNGALFGPHAGGNNRDAIVARFGIPEPSTLGLACVAVVGIFMRRGGRRH